MHEICQLILMKIAKIVVTRCFVSDIAIFVLKRDVKLQLTNCHQMSDFKAKMHQIRFQLGSAPDPAGGAYSAPPDP